MAPIQAKLEQECSKIRDELSENERRLAHWQHNLEQLRLHDIDDESDDEESGEEPEKAAERQANSELRDYSGEELENMDPDQLKAEMAVLEGTRLNLCR